MTTQFKLLLAIAIAATLPACRNLGAPSDADPKARAAYIYHTRCSSCHQPNGTGTIRGNRFAADFTDPSGPLSKTDDQIKHTIQNGIEGRYGMMPAFKPMLSDDEITHLIAYLRDTFGPQKQLPETTTESVNPEGETAPEKEAS